MKLRGMGVVLSVTFIILGAAFACETEGADSNALPERGICSHRGASTLFPENTLPAFEESVKRHAAMIEFDVRFTKDKQLVILHDWTVDRTSDGKGEILNLTFDEVRKLDFGKWKGESFAGTKIPTLDEALAVFPRDVWLNIHIGGAPKSIEAELGLAVADKIIADGRENQAFLACSQRMAEAVNAKYPQFLICNMEHRGDAEDYVNETIGRKCAFIQISAPHPTPDQIKRLKEAGVRINYFGSNDAKEIKALFDLGVEFPLVDDLPVGQSVISEME